MAESFVIIEGRVCRIIGSPEDYAPGQVKVQLVTGSRTKKATAGKRPGPQWRPSPDGDKRKWVTYEDVVEAKVVPVDLVHQGSWPVGMQKYGMKPDDLVAVVTSAMERAMAAGGAAARRTRPNIEIAVIEGACKRAGMPMPTDEEFQYGLNEAWERLSPKVQRPTAKVTVTDGRVLIPPTKNTIVDPPPAGVQVPDGSFWSEACGSVFVDNELNRSIDLAVSTNGWPYELLMGAGLRSRGDAGFTVQYALKVKYDEKVHGEKPAAEKPAAEKPTAEKPVVNVVKPSAPLLVGEDPGDPSATDSNEQS